MMMIMITGRIATASYDKTAKVFDTKSLTLLHTLAGHDKSVYEVMFNNPYGYDASMMMLMISDVIATSSFDNSVNLYDSSTGQCIHNLKGHTREVLCIAFDQSSEIVVSGMSALCQRSVSTLSALCQYNDD